MPCLLFASLTLAAAAEPAAAPVVTVTVSLRELDTASYEAVAGGKLYKSLLVRLVDDGLAFVDASSPAGIVVTLRHAAAGPLEIVVTTAKSEHTRSVDLPGGGDGEGELAVLHATLELVRQARAELATPPSESQPPEPAPAVSSPPQPITPPEKPQPMLAVSSHALLTWSDRWGSGLWDVEGGPRWNGVLLLVGGAASVPWGVAGTLRVREWGLFGGARVRLAGAARAHIDGELNVGIWQTRYRYDDGSQAPVSGTRLDPLVVGRVTLVARLSQSWRVGAQAGGLFTLYQQTHRTAAGVLWRSWPLRPLLGIEVSYLR